MLFLVPKDIKGGLTFITELISQQKFKAVIDRSYAIENIADAFTYTGTGQKVGNVVVNVGNSSTGF
ncbi:MAG: zinc-binding dehydrogenase [Chitinophagaceae bacterium]